MGNILIDVYDKNNNLIKAGIEEVLYNELLKLNFSFSEIEALKAAAVLKRSALSGYIKNSRYYLKNKEAILIDDLNYEKNNALLKKAIDETAGIIALYKDTPVDFYYTECCGGGTANSEDVLGVKINYLRKILCRFCSEKYSEKIIDIEEIAKKTNKIQSYKGEIGNLIGDVNRDETGRITSVNVLGKILSGEEFAKLFELKSSKAYFLVKSILIKTIGKGTGLGMCLEGAENMAKEGKSFKDIINYYYTGTELSKLNEDEISSSLSGRKIVIDPGHGGEDKGNEINGIFEKDVNLIIAENLKGMLEKIRADIVLTRDCDKEVSLIERVKIINSERPDFYISIHQNSFVMPGVNGVEIYCYLNDGEAYKLGEIICSNIGKDLDTVKRGVRFADFYLLRESKVSGVLIECMYMSGDKDKLKYKDKNYLTIADSIYKSICSFYNVEP
ncbi:SpoIID/LytB domain protein [Caloramator quimbayensis]|uniref:SpoIID/LytB domain protein n=1 Tax=Caloramator quimbayensis TaxID=1147123 RepID=A0A1T4WHE0_9CLOT|nr:N-acetylmuramoyl-L-alanine amidase [Caloramator quimbayensis]SKA76325.1 SpoIID/LytB domain protein [Caloramator quimbayensis]